MCMAAELRAVAAARPAKTWKGGRAGTIFIPAFRSPAQSDQRAPADGLCRHRLDHVPVLHDHPVFQPKDVDDRTPRIVRPHPPDNLDGRVIAIDSDAANLDFGIRFREDRLKPAKGTLPAVGDRRIMLDI